MSEIIIPKSFGQQKNVYPFLEICASADHAKQAVNTICRCLAESFDVDEQRMGKMFRQKIQTQHEVKRRTEILAKWFRIMRCECGHSTPQALSLLGQALRTELDGGRFEPPKKASGMYGNPSPVMN